MHDLFKKRRSVRKYKDTMPSDEQIRQILSAAMVAPSANHLNPWEFIVVRDKSKLEELSKCGQWQNFVKNASIAIVVVCNDVKMWREDGAITASHIYLETINQGLGTCWANVVKGKTPEGEDREAYVKKLLNIPDDYHVLCIMPIGYPNETVPEHSEDEYTDSKVHLEMW